MVAGVAVGAAVAGVVAVAEARATRATVVPTSSMMTVAGTTPIMAGGAGGATKMTAAVAVRSRVLLPLKAVKLLQSATYHRVICMWRRSAHAALSEPPCHGASMLVRTA